MLNMQKKKSEGMTNNRNHTVSQYINSADLNKYCTNK